MYKRQPYKFARDVSNIGHHGNGVYELAIKNADKLDYILTLIKQSYKQKAEEDDWFYDAVEYVCTNGMMQGTGSTMFSPEMTTTRGMIVTILYRMEGEPAVTGAADFDDVSAGQWYSDAVAWASANGIVDGYGNGSFGPEDIITREQAAAILYRYAGYKAYDVTATGELNGFADADEISGWAEDAMSWAVGAGLLNGKNGGLLDPTGTATRAEAAAILARFCQNFAE